jgi:Na+-driven multidrug efflux pump
MMRIQAVLYPVITLNVIVFFTLRVGGDMAGTLLLDSGFIWLIVIPTAVVLSLLVKPEMAIFYLIIQSIELIKALLARRLYRRGKWLRNLT